MLQKNKKKQRKISTIIKKQAKKIKINKKHPMKIPNPTKDDKQKLILSQETSLIDHKSTFIPFKRVHINEIDEPETLDLNETNGIKTLKVLEMLREVKEKKAKHKNKVKQTLNKVLTKTKKIGNIENNSMNKSLLSNNQSATMKKKKKFYEKLKQTLEDRKVKAPVISLRTKMMEKLKAARFRFLNEQIYKTDSRETQKIFETDPDAFKAYHEGYRHQVKSWPLNPVNVIIKSIKKM